MAYSLVGTIGVASQGAASAAVTPAWGTGESRTAGNLLICFVSATGAGAIATTPSGWTLANSSLLNNSSAQIFYKIAAGGDAAPTIAAISAGVIAAQLAEFSGNSATPIDKTGTGTGTSSPVTATLNAADTASGELLLVSTGDFRSVARATNDTLTSNHATITQAGSNNGTSSVNHYSFGYALATTSNAGADTAVMTLSITTSITGLAVTAATFQRAPVTCTTTDAPTTSEAITRGITRFATEALTTSEAITRKITRQAVESLSTSEAITRGITRFATESLSTSESAKIPQHLSVTATESLSTSEIFGLKDGDPVSLWPDSSANGNGATQTGAARPTFKIVSGKPRVRFSTAVTPQTLNIPTAVPDAGWTVIVVMASAGVFGGGLNMVSLGSTLGYGTAGPHMYLDGSWQIDAAGIGYTDGSSDTAFHVWSGLSTPALFCDGSSRTLGSGTGFGGGSINVIGARYLQYADGDIQEICPYNVVLSSTDRANIEAGLAAKWGLTVAGGTPVSPDSVAGLAAWWKADILQTSSAVVQRNIIRTASESLFCSDVTGLNDGDTVTTWPDASSNGHDGANVGAPKFKTNIVGTKPVVRLTSSGSDGFNLTTSIPNTAPYTAFVVMKPASPSVELLSLMSATAHGTCSYNYPDGRLYGGSSYFYIYTNTAVDVTAWHIFTLSHITGATANIFTDGTLLPNSGAGNNLDPFTTIGWFSGTPSYSDGDLAEIIYFDLLGPTDRANIEAGLASKYGLTVTSGGIAVDPSTVSGMRGWWKADLMPVTAHANRGLNLVRTASESLSIAQSVTRNTSSTRTAADALATAEATIRILARLFNAVDALLTSESISRSASHPRTTTDSLTTAESIDWIASLKRITSDALTISEVASKMEVTARTATDHPATAESVDWVGLILRSLTDALSTAELASRTKITAQSSTDALTTSESLARTISVLRATADALSTSDSSTRTLNTNRSVTDAIFTADAVSRIASLLRALADALSVSEAATAVRPGGPLSRTAADALATAEAVTRLLAAARSCTENPLIADAVTRLLTLLRAVVDALSTAESAAGSKFGLLARNAVDSLTNAEVATRILSALRSCTDNPTLSESVAKFLSTARSITDALSVAMSANGQKIKLETVLDALSVALSAARTIGTARAAADAPATLESAGRILTALRSVIEILSTSELATSLIAHQAFVRDALDTPALLESVTRILNASRRGTEALFNSESVVQNGSRNRLAIDHPSLSELSTRLILFGRSALDELLISDLASMGPQLLNRLTVDFPTISDVLHLPLNSRFVSEFLSTHDLAFWNIPKIIQILVALEAAKQINIRTTQDLLGLNIQNIVSPLQPINIVTPQEALEVGVTLVGNPTLIDILVTGRN